MHRARLADVEDAAVGLVQRLVVVGHAELRPAPHQLGGVEALVADAGVVHRDRVAVEDLGPLAPAPRDVDHPGRVHERDAGLRLDLAPGRVGARRQRRVGGAVVAEPDDPRVVLGRAQPVAELPLLEAQHLVAGATAEPVGGGAPDPTAADRRRSGTSLQPLREGQVVRLQARVGAEVGVLGHVGRVAARGRPPAHRLGHRADVVRRRAAAQADVLHAERERVAREVRDVVAGRGERVERGRERAPASERLEGRLGLVRAVRDRAAPRRARRPPRGSPPAAAASSAARGCS